MQFIRHAAALVLCAYIMDARAEVRDSRFSWGGREEHPAVVNPVVAIDDGSVISLRGEWDFIAMPMKQPWRGGPWRQFYKEEWKVSDGLRKIGVPGCWEAQGVGEEGMGESWNAIWDHNAKPVRHKYMGDGWYRKTVDIPSSWAGRRIWLKVGGVKSKGWFWVNDAQVALVDNYCGTCKYEITDLVKPGEKAKVVVQVNNVLPSRKGLMSAMHKWGGIYRDVEFEATPQTFIDDAWVRGLFDEKAAEVHVKVVRHPLKSSLHAVRVTLLGGPGQCVETTAFGGETVVRLPLPNFRPWSPEHPNLYTARVDLVENGQVIQTRLERFGVRKFEVRGKEFYLNGKPFYVRGFGDDHVYPITGITPPDRETHRAHLAKARAAGFNYVRLHTHCELPEYFEAADELGIMIQPELPYYCDVPTESFEFDPKRDVEELWRNYRRHPSFAVYCMGNEGSYGAAADAAMHKFVKAMDPDRLKINQDSNVLRLNSPETADWVGGPINVWKRGSFDPDRPFVAHEYLNLCVKVDTRDEPLYSGVWMPPVTRNARAKWLAAFGLDHLWGDRLQDAQHALQRFYQKRGIECARKDPYCDGYDFWTIVDVVVVQRDTCTAQGLFNPFWETKRGGFSAEGFAQFNSPSCVLLDEPDERRVYSSGDEVKVDFLFAHYGEAPIADARLDWSLEGGCGGEVKVGDIALGPARKIATAAIRFPEVEKPRKAVLSASVGGVKNSWDFWVFPKRALREGRDIAVAPSLAEAMGRLYEGFSVLGSPEAAKARVVVAEGGSAEAEAALKEGRMVVAIGDVKDVPNVKLGWWWMGRQVGTALAKSPVFGDLPHEGVLSPLVFRIIGVGKSLKGAKYKADDLFMVGEGGGDCYAYLARRQVGSGVAVESFGLDLLSGTPEGTAILDGILDFLRQRCQ